MTPTLARRRDAFLALGAEPFDLLVIGGGINGAGIARDAAMRGLRTAVVERSDFASGTSSRSSKLIHGGLRYLQQGRVRLVLESVRERERLRRLAPHLVRPQEFVVPLYEGGPVRFTALAAGLWIYDVLAGLWGVRRHQMLRPRALLEVEPALRREGLRGAGVYWDYRTDDARLVLETAMSAAREGAVVLSYAEVTALLKEGGRIVGARVVDRLNDQEAVVSARVVVNAAGPWLDRVTALDVPAPPRLGLTKGVHVLVPRARVGHRAAIALYAVADRRAMFVIPWGDQDLVGTTDTDHHGGPDAKATVDPADIAYLLETVNHYFPAARLTSTDVISAFAGYRPLVAPPVAGGAPSDVSREEDIFTSDAGLISLAGGKLTTYRLIAEEVVDRVVEVLRRGGEQRRIGRSRTGEVPLPGGTAVPAVLASAAISRDGHGLAPATIEHLADRYGSRLDEVLGLVARDGRLAERLLPGRPEPRAEVLEAVEHEWALTLEDVLRRRTQLALRDPTAGSAAVAEVAALMAGPLGWDAQHMRAAVESYLASARAECPWR